MQEQENMSQVKDSLTLLLIVLKNNNCIDERQYDYLKDRLEGKFP